MRTSLRLTVGKKYPPDGPAKRLACRVIHCVGVCSSSTVWLDEGRRTVWWWCDFCGEHHVSTNGLRLSPTAMKGAE
jgi:hypothetical protein